ncbi:porin [Paraburkholderia silvatlantica]|uniref:Porin n=1 Tax=Paraburkholderia silvatlantica TaxID=321895 RepID=A0ABR6G0S1_9BURK|nr:porin [Paraburkholderia silvatlantica]MBB2932957.1 putative porin [Paraburkholderia silvatlantica]PVY16817.1 putative porin [Paraburkholderia silvatlantica]PXW23508.1 putative porin [Paraburkholderia silvatlantica]
MKRAIFILAAGIGVPGISFAQNSVTLYGAIDNGLTYVNNAGGKTLIKAASGADIGSRWGLLGTEDLGGGLKTIFRLENGFNSFNGSLGQGGLLFGRQAYVGLSSSDGWGTVTMGRQYDLIVDYIGPSTLNLQNWGAYSSHANDIDNTNDAFRVNNSVKYKSPTYAGLTFSAMYAFGGIAGSFGRNSTTAAGASYVNGNLYVAAAYFFAKDPGTQFPDGNFVANHSTNAGVFGYVGQPANQQIIGVGGTYKLNAATFGLNYTNTHFDDANGTTSSVSFDSYEAWMQYNLTPALLVGGGYNFVDGKVNYSGQRPKYHQVDVVASYALSKRTDIAFQATYQRAAGGAYADIDSAVVGAQSSTNTQVALHAGLRVRF